MNFLKQKQKQIMLTLVGRGAKYSGVMYLSPTLEIMFETEPRSLLDADVDDVEICSRIVMWSRFEEFKQNRNYSQKLILMPFTLFFGLWDRSHNCFKNCEVFLLFCKNWKYSFVVVFLRKIIFGFEQTFEDTSQKQA